MSWLIIGALALVFLFLLCKAIMIVCWTKDKE